MAVLRVLLLSSENTAHMQVFFRVRFMHFVYIIQAGRKGPYKIGMTSDVERRLDELQTGNHKKLYIIAKVDFGSRKEALCAERALHSVYEKSKIRGEWFSPKIKLKTADKYFKTDFKEQQKGAGRKEARLRESMRLDLELLRDKDMY